MFETIVWATDGSELADRALPYVKELARANGSRIVAVHANELLRGRFGGAPLLADEPDVREQIEQQIEELKAEGFDVELKVASGTGDTAELVAHAAVDVDADLIVLGTHGHGGIKSAVLGSVARGLLHASSCPVLAIPPEREVAETARDGEKATVA
jgi:nucleotide-binding universal stress UspA family protein